MNTTRKGTVINIPTSRKDTLLFEVPGSQSLIGSAHPSCYFGTEASAPYAEPYQSVQKPTSQQQELADALLKIDGVRGVAFLTTMIRVTGINDNEDQIRSVILQTLSSQSEETAII